MPFSLHMKLQLQDLRPTNITTQLTDYLLKYPAGFLEGVPIQVCKLFIPSDFIVMDIDESSQVPIILGNLFVAISRALFEVLVGKISFQFCEEMVDICLPPPTALFVLVPMVPIVLDVPVLVFGIQIFDGDAIPHLRSCALFYLPALILRHSCSPQVGNGFTSIHYFNPSISLRFPSSIA